MRLRSAYSIIIVFVFYGSLFADVVTASITTSSSGGVAPPANGQQYRKLQIYPIRNYVSAFQLNSVTMRAFGNPAWIGDIIVSAYSDESLSNLLVTQTFSNQIISSSGLTMNLSGFNVFPSGQDFWMKVNANRNNSLSAGVLMGSDYYFLGLNNNNADQILVGSTSSSGLIYAASPSIDGNTFLSMDISMTASVPEPGTFLLGAFSAFSGGLGIWWKRKRKVLKTVIENGWIIPEKVDI